ncbi:uncharacterized protein LOC62_05G007106 [Vanrija pseudolonga]|uniref:Uncharacterized protein n=1 Tax=Vanrija pseudolonga TaxID=143232 RepID=A0AAF0YHC2_9TREE|nr:hypothetical protein LOC62_05G007106 [Vanrija pseudolonga]
MPTRSRSQANLRPPLPAFSHSPSKSHGSHGRHDYPRISASASCPSFPPTPPESISEASSSSTSPDPSAPFSISLTAVSVARSAFFKYVVPRLPPELQEIAYNPPKVTDPASLVPLLRAVAPYTQFMVLILALYVVWCVVAGIVGYFARFLRFAFRIAPVIALIAWVMAASGQGGIDVLFEALKQYAGVDDPANRAPGARGGAAAPAGAAGRAGSYYFGGSSSDAGSRTSTTNRRARSRSHSSGSDSDSDSSFWSSSRESKKEAGAGTWPRSPPATGKGAKPEQGDAPDVLKMLFGSSNVNVNDDGLAAVVQDYVKRAVVRASGLEWLLGGSATTEVPKQQVPEAKRDSRKRR